MPAQQRHLRWYLDFRDLTDIFRSLDRDRCRVSVMDTPRDGAIIKWLFMSVAC